MENKVILMLGTFDSKGREFAYLHGELLRRGAAVLTMNTGVLGATDLFPIDIPAEQVAQRGGVPLETLRRNGDRGEAMAVMCAGARALCKELQEAGRIQGVIGMGGGGGTSIATTAMQALPVGFPKVCVTTLASGDTSAYVGSKDILLFPSIVDISGINRFSRLILSRAAGAVCGMTQVDPIPRQSDLPIVMLSMFGNTTACVEECARLLQGEGYDSLVFHATGSGGRAMEELIREGVAVAALDITTTEWADELCGGALSAGPHRLEAPGQAGIPHVIVPGCLDMVNFGALDTVPQRYREAGRKLYQWNPLVTLMRTNEEESAELGRILAEKANASPAPVAFLLPEGGLSILDAPGQRFWDPQADRALFEAIRRHAKADIPIVKADENINDPAFARRAVGLLMEIIPHS
ncbi:MAG: Tm-1-like ATP-binding domain-containing protein [Candidatus Limiplasma sp.]|nr:Tm-1-like ATP-binding domain-containing protein [Candidatus Limiplasma sp.]